jgi:hypothetical protein
MRILKALSSEAHACGCLLGIYETYNGDVVSLVDAVGEYCRTHTVGQQVEAGGGTRAQRPSDLSTARPSS